MPETYDRVARTLHWLVAGLVIVPFVTAWGWKLLPSGSPILFYLSWTHIVCGYALLAVATLRILWRLTHRAPPLPAGMSRAARLTAHTTHVALYAAIVVQPILGMVRVSEVGTSFPWTGPIHVALAYVIAGIVGLHVAAATWHQYVRRDGLLTRMLPAR